MRFFTLFFILTFFVTKGQTNDALVNLNHSNELFEYDIRYATTNNFTKQQLYACAVCLLQPEVAQAIEKANAALCEIGYRIVFFDCYRPLSVQKKMWEIMPRATYVANPFEKGSVHNRGAAVDISLVTLEGCEVDMGSDYDYFGRASHIDNNNLPKRVIENRRILQEAMKAQGFKTVRTEWWHFSYKKSWSYPIMDKPLPCE